MKSFLSGLLTGLLLPVGIAAYFYFYHQDDLVPEKVKVTQVSGEKIEHEDFDYKSKSIKFKTHSEGKGEIITEIPKTNIPEARAWMEDTNCLVLELLLVERRVYGITYLKRWNNISAGGGILVSGQKFEGVKLQTEYWFSL